MGIWSWLFGESRSDLDTTRFSEPRLRALWGERSELTDEAREAVRAELLERGVQLSSLERLPDSEDSSDSEEDDDAPGRAEPRSSATIKVTLPPVHIHPSDRLHIVDLRAIDDVTEALEIGVRLGVEMDQFLRHPYQRSFAFSPSVTQALIADGSLLAPVKNALRFGLPLPEQVTGTTQVRKGEVGIFVPSTQLVAARTAFEAVDVVPVAETAKLGPERRDPHVIHIPSDKAEVHSLEDVSIASMWSGRQAHRGSALHRWHRRASDGSSAPNASRDLGAAGCRTFARRGHRISGNRNVAPDLDTKRFMHDHSVGQVVTSVRLCLDPAGVPEQIAQLSASCYPRYENAILTAMHDWRYSAYMVNGVAVPVCTAVSFIYRQH